MLVCQPTEMCKEVSKYLFPSFEKQNLYLGIMSLSQVGGLGSSRLQRTATPLLA